MSAHRSFPEAADGRPALPMEAELWAAGCDLDTARFAARMLGDQGYELTMVGYIDALKERVKELEAEAAAWEQAALNNAEASKSHCERVKELEEENGILLATMNSYRQEAANLRRLLSRYRTETPVGHQPHMICDEVDDAIARAALTEKGD